MGPRQPEPAVPAALRRMIRESFVHLPGIGKATERRLWRAGVLDWASLRSTALGKKQSIAEALRQSEAALDQRDLSTLFERFPVDERWRLFPDFENDFIGVDIETTGLSTYDVLTVVGIESSQGFQAFVRGANLDQAREVLESAKGLMTFNGTLFDLPFIRRTFPGIRLPDVHLDLRFLGRRAGFRGSLKRVERQAGIARDDDIGDLTGHSAVVLWNEYEQGNLESLARLVRYNSADTANLRHLCRVIVQHLTDALHNVISEEDYQHRLFAEEPAATLIRTPSSLTSVQYADIGFSDTALFINGLELQAKAEQKPPAITLCPLLSRMPDSCSRIVGIDLSGSEDRRTGWALLERNLVATAALRTTEDILKYTLASEPALVSIDSPLTIPAGRDCTLDDCACRVHGISRSSERELKRRGISVYWCLIRSMQALTRRGMQLAAVLREAGIQVIESYPGAAQDIMRIPRKGTSKDQLRDGLIRFGVNGIPPMSLTTHDELDAVTSAIVGSFFLAEQYEPLGNDVEGYLIVPRLSGLEEARAGAGDGCMSRNEQGILLVVHGDADERILDHLGTLSVAVATLPLTEFLDGHHSTGVTAARCDGVSPETLLTVYGPRARHIVALPAGQRMRRTSLPQCDFAINVDAESWRADLESWLRDLSREGTSTCH